MLCCLLSYCPCCAQSSPVLPSLLCPVFSCPTVPVVPSLLLSYRPCRAQSSPVLPSLLCPVFSCPTVPVVPSLLLSYRPCRDNFLLSCPTLPCRAQSSPVLPCPVVPSLFVPYPALLCPVFLPYPVRLCPVFSCPTLSCPVFSCPSLHCRVLPCPALTWPSKSNICYGNWPSTCSTDLIAVAQILKEGYAAHLTKLSTSQASRPAVGNSRLIIRKACFGLPTRPSKSKSKLRRTVSDKPGEEISQDLPSTISGSFNYSSFRHIKGRTIPKFAQDY